LHFFVSPAFASHSLLTPNQRNGPHTVTTRGAYLGKNGKQYVVITSAPGGFLDSPLTGDSINAFTLP